MYANWQLNGLCVVTEDANKKQLLKDVHMTFKAGEITLLIGRNGAGKSTLLETMAGIRTIQSGIIELGNDSLWVEKKRKTRINRDVVLKLGISMQNAESQWFASSVREELEYSLKPYQLDSINMNKRIEQAIVKAGLPEAMLERDPWTLSGGQQRRLSLACLLACEPDWLLLDEPTAGLDADGIRLLCAVLEAHRAAGRGVVVATHDLDALLPLADAVAVVSGGTVRAAAREAAISHAASAPQALRTLEVLRVEAAMPLAQLAARGDEAPWPSPTETAAVIALELKGRGGIDATAAMPFMGNKTEDIPFEMLSKSGETQEAVRADDKKTGLLRPDYFDPRALVLVYLFLAASIFAQKSALELSIAAVATILLLMPFRTLIWPWRRVIRAYVIMIIIFCVIAGIGVSPLSFDFDKVWPLAMRFCKLLLILLLGMPMLKLMTPYRLQRSIEQTFGFLEKLKVPVHSFAIIVTLIFRFIPLLTGEWERFAKLSHARGKAVTPLKTVPFNRLLPTLIPYVRSILRLAEQMADALEARGFGYTKRKPTYSFRLRFGHADARLISIAGTTGILLFLAVFLL